MNSPVVFEALLLILLIGATVLPIWLGVRLRKTRPGVLWIGLLLSLLFGPVGQSYVEGWVPWALILTGVMFAAQYYLPPGAAMLVMLMISPLAMYFRMGRMK